MNRVVSGSSSRSGSRALLGLAAAVGGISLACASNALAEDVWANHPQVSIRYDPSPAGKLVGVAPQGVQFHVLERRGDPGQTWIKVSGPFDDGGDGWVFEKSVSIQPINAASSGVGGSSQAQSLSVGAAGKGLQPDAATYIDAKHLEDEKGKVQEMRDTTAKIDPAALKQFMTAGKVGQSGK